MSDLPYIQPKKELDLNMGILLLILDNLAETVRGKRNLNIEKMQIFYFLVNNPLILNKALSMLGQQQRSINHCEYYTVENLLLDVDDLYDKSKIALLLKMMSIKGYISVEFNKNEGFVFYLSEEGKKTLLHLDCNYFNKVREIVKAASILRSKSLGKLNGLVNTVVR